MSQTRMFLLSLLALAGLALAVQSAAAGTRYGHGPIIGYVTADSHYGNGSVKGAVRNTPVGRQVRLPSGDWTYCRTSCSETLRVQTVDIFGNGDSMVGYGTMQNECGVFGCLIWSWPH